MTLPTSEIPPDQAFLAHLVDFAAPHLDGIRAGIARLRAGLPDSDAELEAFVASEEFTSVKAHAETLGAIEPQGRQFAQVVGQVCTEYAEAMDEALKAREERRRGRQ